MIVPLTRKKHPSSARATRRHTRSHLTATSEIALLIRSRHSSNTCAIHRRIQHALTLQTLPTRSICDLPSTRMCHIYSAFTICLSASVESTTRMACLKEHDTSIMGKFACINMSCTFKSWISKQIAITVQQYPGRRYNARDYSQRCEACDSLS